MRTYSNKRVVAQKGRLLDVCVPGAPNFTTHADTISLIAGIEVRTAWRTRLHVYVANEALQHTRCPRNLCCMKTVFASKQLRSCLQVSAAG